MKLEVLHEQKEMFAGMGIFADKSERDGSIFFLSNKWQIKIHAIYKHRQIINYILQHQETKEIGFTNSIIFLVPFMTGVFLVLTNWTIYDLASLLYHLE